jgi:hypothetical protein
MPSDYFNVVVDDIDEFSAVKDIERPASAQWQSVMRSLPEAFVKDAICSILGEEATKDWGG